MKPDTSYNQHSGSSPTDSLNQDSTPIVLLHGWGMNKNIWLPFIESLSNELQQRITTLDLPGFGSNEFMPAQYDMANLANWLDQQVQSKSIVLGWSLGGLVAQQFAIEQSKKVHKLGLIASSPKFMSDTDWKGIEQEVLTLFADQLSIDHKLTIERFLAIQAMGTPSAKQDIKRIRDLVLSAPTPKIEALIKGLDLLQDVDLRDSFSNFKMPVSGIFGRLDSLIPHKTVKVMASMNQDLDIEVINKASHAPFISHPEQFKDWFERFVN